jgi:type IV secretion system protein VirB6
MGFFAQFFAWLQLQLGAYIGNTAAAVAAAIEPAAVALAAIYVMVWGWLSATGRIEEPLVEAVKRVLLLGVVFGAGLKLWAYAPVFIDTFAQAPQVLAANVLGVNNPVAIIDQIWASAQTVAESLQQQAGIIHLVEGYLAALVVYLLVGLLCIYTAFLLALSQIAVAVLLGIGPIFIILILFDATRRFFEAWIAQLANYALVTVLVALVGALLLNMVKAYATTAAANGNAITIAETVRLCTAAVFIFLILRQVLSIAAGLASGVALSTFGTVSRALSRIFGSTNRSAYQFGRGLFDREARHFDPLRRQAGYYVKQGVKAAVRVARPSTWTTALKKTGSTAS